MKIKFIILLLLFPLTAISSPMDVMNKFYGNYKVTDAKRYSGGLTDDADAKLKIGMIYSVCPGAFKGLRGSLYQPLYDFSSTPYTLEDGVVESKNYSTYYGFYNDRKSIDVVSIVDSKSKETYTFFEIIDSNTILTSFDGFIYIMRFEGKC